MFRTGDHIVIKNQGQHIGWTGMRCTVINTEGGQTYLHPLSDRPDMVSNKRMDFYWPTSDLRLLTSDEALSALREKLAGAPAPVRIEDSAREQHGVEYNLSIVGPDFANRDVPDFVVEAAGQAVHEMINEVLDEARQKIAENLGQSYKVTFDPF